MALGKIKITLKDPDGPHEDIEEYVQHYAASLPDFDGPERTGFDAYVEEQMKAPDFMRAATEAALEIRIATLEERVKTLEQIRFIRRRARAR